MNSNDIIVDLQADMVVNTEYVYPVQKKYSIKTRAQAASSMSQAKGKPDYGTVMKAACRKFPDLPGCSAVTMSQGKK
jgi:hypothetical protein